MASSTLYGVVELLRMLVRLRLVLYTVTPLRLGSQLNDPIVV